MAAVATKVNDDVEYIKIGDDVSFFTQESTIEGFMACPLSTQQYSTALIQPATNKGGEQADGIKRQSEPGGVGNFQSCVFQLLVGEKFKRIRKLEKLIDSKIRADGKRRVDEQRKRDDERDLKAGKVKQEKVPAGGKQKLRFRKTANEYKEPADVLPDSTIAECLDDPEFNTHKDTKRAIDDARIEIRENEMEQTRRHGAAVEYGMVVQLWHRQHRQFLRVSPSKNAKLDPANMRVELHPTASVESFWRIMPRFKVRSIGDKVRTHDEIVLERASSRGQYVGVSDHPIRSNASSDFTENEFCTPRVHEVSASVKKASFVIDKYTANDELQRPRISASGSLEDAVFQGIDGRKLGHQADTEGTAPPICAGDVIQLFHKDSDCWVAAEGIYRDPIEEDSSEAFAGFGVQRDDVVTDAAANNGTLAIDIHLRQRRQDIEKPNKSKPPTSAVSYFQVEQAEIYTGGKIGFRSGVRFRHLTSQLYLAAGKKETGTKGDPSAIVGTKLISNGTTGASVFFIHPVVESAVDHVPSDAYIRIQHAESKHWLHADVTTNVLRDGVDPDDEEIVEDEEGCGIQNAETVIWDKAGLKTLLLTEKQHFHDAFSARLVPEESVYSVATVAGTIPMLRQYIKRRALRELTALEAAMTANMLNELYNFLFERKIPIKLRQKLLRDLKIIDLLVEMVQAPFHPSAAEGSGDLGAVGKEAAQKLSNTTQSGLKTYDAVGDDDNRNTMMVMNAAFRVLNAILVGDSRKLELYVSRNLPFLWTMFGTKMSVESLINELIRDNAQLVELCGDAEVKRVVELLTKKDGKDPNYLEFLSVLCVCENAPVKRLQDMIGKWLLRQRGKDAPLFNTRVAPGGTGILLTTNGDWESNAQDLYAFASSALDEKDETSTAEYLFLQRQLELFGNMCKGRNAKNIASITKKELTWEECFVCVQSDYSKASFMVEDGKKDPHPREVDTNILLVNPKTWKEVDAEEKAKISEEHGVDLVIPDKGHTGEPKVAVVQLKRLPKSLRRLYVDLIVNLFLDTPAPANEKANRDVLSEIELTFDWDLLKYTHYTAAAAYQTRSLSGATFVHFPLVKKWIFDVLDNTGAMVHADDLVGQPLNKLLTSVLNLLWTLIKYGYYADKEDIEALMPVLKSVINGTNDTKISQQQLAAATRPKLKRRSVKGTLSRNKSPKVPVATGGEASGGGGDSDNLIDTEWLDAGRYMTDNENNKVVVVAKFAALQCVDALFNFVFNVRLRFMMCDFKLAAMLNLESQHNTARSIAAAEKELKMDSASLKRTFKHCETNWDRVGELRAGRMLELLASMMSHEVDVTSAVTNEVRDYLHDLKSKCDWIDPGWELGDGSKASAKALKRGEELSLVGILLDLAMYQDEHLMVKCLGLINRIYSSEHDLCKLAVQAQVLTTPESKYLAAHAKDNLPAIKAISQGILTGDQVSLFNDTVDYWTKMCYLDSAQNGGKEYGAGGWEQPGKPHRVNQTILLNSGIVLVLMDVIDTPNQFSSVLRNCFWLLRALCLNYPEVQVKLYESLDAILNTDSPTMKPGDSEDAMEFEAWENSLGGTVSEIFNGCRETCLRVKPAQVETMLNCVGRGSAKQTFKSAKLLNALAAVSKVEEWNLPLKHNQELIMKFLWATKTSVVDISAIDEQSDPAINRKRMLLLSGAGNAIPRVNGEPDALTDPIALAYHIDLVFLLASNCEGENREIEAMCRSIFTLQELVDTLIAAPPHTVPLDQSQLATGYQNRSASSPADAGNDTGADEVIAPAHSEPVFSANPSPLGGHRPLLSTSERAKQMLVANDFKSRWPGFNGISHKTKASYMSFLLWSYLNTQSTALEIGTGTLHSDDVGQQLLEALAVIGKEEIDLYFKEDGRFPDVSSMDIGGRKIGMTHEEAVFVYDLYIPIVEKLALDHFPSTPDGQECFGVLANTCSEFMARAMEQWESGQSHLDRFRNNVAVRALSALKTKLEPMARTSATFNQKQLRSLVATLASVSETGLNFLEAGMSHDSALGNYQKMYKIENEKNENFNNFVLHLKGAYVGQNTVAAQLAPLEYPTGTSTKGEPFDGDADYDTSDKPGTLPLGPEFQHLVALFCLFEKKGTTLDPNRLGVLVRLWKCHSYIAASASARDLESFNDVTEKALQIMIAACENAQHVSFQVNDPKIDVQDQIVKSGALLDISFLFGSSSSSVQIESISALAAVMEGGNMGAQRIFERYFLDTREELFFLNVSNLLELASESISEIRMLRRQKEASDRAQANLRKTMSGTIKALQQQGKKGSKSRKTVKPSAKDVVANPAFDASSSVSAEDVMSSAGPNDMVISEQDPLDLGDGSHGHYEVLLIVLQAMCEGNNKITQNYLREQPDNSQNFNLVAMVTNGLSALLQESPIHQDSVKLIAQAVTTLTEFCQGNRDNQRNAFDSRIFDCLNIMLRIENGDLDARGQATGKGNAHSGRKTRGRTKEMETLFATHSIKKGYLDRTGLDALCKAATLKQYQRDSVSPDTWKEICQSVSATDPERGLTEAEFKKWCNSKFESGAAFRIDGGVYDYDENVVQMHLCAAKLLGRILETNNDATRYLANQIDGMIELPVLVRLFREYSTMGGVHMDGINEKEDIAMNMLSGKIKASAIAFELYNVFVRLELYTGTDYHRDKFLLGMDDDFKLNHGGVRNDPGQPATHMGTKDFTTAYEEMDKNTAIVEVLVDYGTEKVIEHIHFIIKQEWRVDHPNRESVLWSVERGAVTEQVSDYMEKGIEIAANMKHSESYRDNWFYNFLIQSNIRLNSWFLIWTFVVNAGMLLTWVAPRDGSAKPLISVPFASHSDDMVSDVTVTNVMNVLGLVHVILTGMMLFSFFLTNPPSLWNSKMPDPNAPKTSKEAQQQKMERAKKNQNIDIIRELRAANFYFIDTKQKMKYLPVFSGTSFYYLFMMTCSILGVVYHGYTFSFCLLHVTHGNDILSRVLRAVTENGISLLYVALLLVILIYIYALIGFGFYRHYYDPNSCYNMVQCFFTSLRLGLLSGGGLGDGLSGDALGDTYEPAMTPARIVFDISFFLLITIIGLNIVFGIIVDTFSELREDKQDTEAKMRDECFICGLPSIAFDRFGNGWKHHILKEHNMWDYLYLVRHVDLKPATEFTFLEQYVAEKIYKEENDFYPFGRALAMPPGVPGGEPAGGQSGTAEAASGSKPAAAAESGPTLEKLLSIVARLEAKIDALDDKVGVF